MLTIHLIPEDDDDDDDDDDVLAVVMVFTASALRLLAGPPVRHVACLSRMRFTSSIESPLLHVW